MPKPHYVEQFPFWLADGRFLMFARSRSAFATLLSDIVGHEVPHTRLAAWERQGHLPPFGEDDADARTYLDTAIHLATARGEGIPPRLAVHTIREEQEEVPMIDNVLIEIDRLAQERVARDPSLKLTDALTQVLGERPDLYYRYTRAMASARERRKMMEGATGRLTLNDLRGIVDSAMTFTEPRSDPRTRPPDTKGLPGWNEIDQAVDQALRTDATASFLGMLSVLQTSRRAAWREFEREFHALSIGPDSLRRIKEAIDSMRRPDDWRRALGLSIGDDPRAATERTDRYFVTHEG